MWVSRSIAGDEIKIYGISIDSSDEDENADDSIRINRAMIQMNLMKVCNNQRNMMIQNVNISWNFNSFK
jgi:hypothetical protein